MKFTIKDKRFIQKYDEIIDYIQNDFSGVYGKLLLKGVTNVSKVEENKTEFVCLDYRPYDGYLLIENKTLGAYVVREDNLNEIIEIEDVLDDYGIDRIIRNGNKTILLDSDGAKFITTRQEQDKDDIEKAIMILLLKRAGYSIKDVYDIIATIK